MEVNIPVCEQWQMKALIHYPTWTWLQQRKKLLPLFASSLVPAAKVVKDDQL